MFRNFKSDILATIKAIYIYFFRYYEKKTKNHLMSSCSMNFLNEQFSENGQYLHFKKTKISLRMRLTCRNHMPFFINQILDRFRKKLMRMIHWIFNIFQAEPFLVFNFTSLIGKIDWLDWSINRLTQFTRSRKKFFIKICHLFIYEPFSEIREIVNIITICHSWPNWIILKYVD